MQSTQQHGGPGLPAGGADRVYPPVRPGQAVRALGLAVLGAGAALGLTAVFGRLAAASWTATTRPTVADPADVLLTIACVLGAVLSAWLGVGTVAATAATLPGAVGRAGAFIAEQIAPAALRRSIAFVLGTSLVGAFAPGTAAAAVDASARSAVTRALQLPAEPAPVPDPGFRPTRPGSPRDARPPTPPPAGLGPSPSTTEPAAPTPMSITSTSGAPTSSAPTSGAPTSSAPTSSAPTSSAQPSPTTPAPSSRTPSTSSASDPPGTTPLPTPTHLPTPTPATTSTAPDPGFVPLGPLGPRDTRAPDTRVPDTRGEIGSPEQTDPAAPGPVYIVRPGDTLWSIAARHLPRGAGTAQLAAAWPLWYAANRAVIGSDPDLIRPGQRLLVPAGAQR